MEGAHCHSYCLQHKEYIVNVHTSNIKYSGTDANVFINIYGKKGDTGGRALAKSSTYRDKFERGHVDVFTVPAVDLGEMEKIRIWHDNSGMGASWHLEKVVVVDPDTKLETVFPGNRWFSTKEVIAHQV